MHRIRHHVRPKALTVELVERLLGRGERLIRTGADLPLIVAGYPRGSARFAAALSECLRFTLPSLPRSIRDSYQSVLAALPTVIVADLRKRNTCACLGHHHQAATLPSTRRLAGDTGVRVGEIDLAIEAIRDWEPLPLSTLAVPATDRARRARLADLRFHGALLSVFLHELEHVAFPERAEGEIRARSDDFYSRALQALLRSEFGADYGLGLHIAS